MSRVWQRDDLTVEAVTGAAFEAALPSVARLRVAVFREWPYLYDGTVDYEQKYLTHFAQAKGAVIVVARQGENIIGVATGAPLAEHTKEFVPLFASHGFDPDRIFYFGESVLLPQFRGRGIGHAFFDLREAQARAATGATGNFTHTSFCGVVRPADHPARPSTYVPLDAFWTRRGYTKVEGMLGSYTWKEVGADEETRKPMQFWIRPL